MGATFRDKTSFKGGDFLFAIVFNPATVQLHFPAKEQPEFTRSRSDEYREGRGEVFLEDSVK